MRILYITNNYLKGGSGAIYATKSFVNSFAAVADEMTVLFPYKTGLEPKDINPIVTLVPISDERSKVRKFVDLAFGKMHRYGKNTTAYFDKSKYDVAVFDSSIVSFHLIKTARKAGLKCITIHHNYQVEFVRDDTQWYLLPTMLLWTYFSEKEAVLNSDLNLTLTQTDINSLSAHYDRNGKFEVIGVSDFVLKDYIAESDDRKDYNFIITGQLASIQTEQSLIPWLDTYYPIMKKVCPDCTLTVAGRSPSQKLIDACRSKGVVIIPSPVDMKPILDGGSFFICPTSLGSGLKLRNMDGLRAGMQVLTHERSARGYERMVDAGVMYRYSNPTEFECELKKMISKNISKQDVLDAYKSYFSLNAGIERLKKILEEHNME